jgi:hypothetical protein
LLFKSRGPIGQPRRRMRKKWIAMDSNAQKSAMRFHADNFVAGAAG